MLICFRFHRLLRNPLMSRSCQPIVFDLLLKLSNKIYKIFREGESHESFYQLYKIRCSLLALSSSPSFFFLSGHKQAKTKRKKKKEKRTFDAHTRTHTQIGQLNKHEIRRQTKQTYVVKKRNIYDGQFFSEKKEKSTHREATKFCFLVCESKKKRKRVERLNPKRQRRQKILSPEDRTKNKKKKKEKEIKSTKHTHTYRMG